MYRYLRLTFVGFCLATVAQPCQAQPLTPEEERIFRQVEDASRLAHMVVDLIAVQNGDCRKLFSVDAASAKRLGNAYDGALQRKHRDRYGPILETTLNGSLEDRQDFGVTAWCQDARARLEKAGHGTLFRK
jgi:hypothetical protein